MSKNELGISYMQEGKWEEAAKAFSEAIEENPNDAVAYINFGNVLTAVGETEKAVNFYKKALTIDENAGAAFYALGNLYYESEQYKDAKEFLMKAIQSGLENSDCYFMLGMTLQQVNGLKLDKSNEVKLEHL